MLLQGENVDEASPHNRRKPQMHRCEYCGRVDKYPSKIKVLYIHVVFIGLKFHAILFDRVLFRLSGTEDLR